MEHVKLSEFTPDPKNANKGTERGRGMLEKSLQELGAGRSVLADKHGILIAGNKTLQTAVEAGFEDAIVVESDGTRLVIVKRTDLDLSTDEKAKQLAIADNRVGQISLEWDADVLAELAGEVDLSGLFFPDELANLMPTAEPPTAEEDEETTADLMEQAESGEIESRVSLGQIWKLGRHILACGDSTSESNVKKLLGDRFKDVGMVWADPPYGISAVDEKTGQTGGLGRTGKYGYSFGGSKSDSKPIKNKKYAPIAGDNTLDAAINSSTLSLELFQKSMQIWWGANNYSANLPNSNCWLIWDKQTDALFADAEIAWTNKSGAIRLFTHKWSGVCKASEHGQKRVHPTQKPIALCEWCFEKYGKPDDLIFDPFLGSAPSIIAAQQMEGDRAVFGFELSPDYVEVILRRFESFTGQTAELVGTL